MSMDKSTAKAISEDVREALKSVAEKHGLQVKVAGGRYDSEVGTFAPKVEFYADDKDQKLFEMYAPMFGLQPTDFGRTFTARGRSLKVVGVAPNSTRYPIIVQEVATGKRLKMQEADVARLLGSAVTA